MKKKGLKFILLFYAAGVVFACCGDNAYFDYTSIRAEARETFITSESELEIEVLFQGVYYMAGMLQKPAFFQGAYAMSCDEGYEGPKHPTTDITITSNADFSETLPSGTNLNGIFEIEFYPEGSITRQREYINSVTPEDLDKSYYYIFLNERPDISSTHTFTFTITNTSGATYSHTTEPITWEQP